MAMTNALNYGAEKLIPEFLFYQILKETVSSPGFVLTWSKLPVSPLVHAKEKQNFPFTSRDQLKLISAFFGFSKSKLGEIFGVTRQSIYNWFDNTGLDNEHYVKIKRLADIAFEVDPQPSQPIFHIYANDVMEGYEKSLINYLLDDDFDKDTVVRLSRTIYELSRERWKRIDVMPQSRTQEK